MEPVADAPQLADELAHLSRGFGQAFGAEDDQGDEENDEDLGRPDAAHTTSVGTAGAGPARSAPARELVSALGEASAQNLGVLAQLEQRRSEFGESAHLAPKLNGLDDEAARREQNRDHSDDRDRRGQEPHHREPSSPRLVLATLPLTRPVVRLGEPLEPAVFLQQLMELEQVVVADRGARVPLVELGRQTPHGEPNA